MIQHYIKLYEKLPFFDKKPVSFQESFCTVYGNRIRDEEDVFLLTDDLHNLMWDKIKNGKYLRKGEVYDLWGHSDIVLSSGKNRHHWPPSSRDESAKTMKIPEDFHQAWHIIFMNLYKKEEMRNFWRFLFAHEEIDSGIILYATIDMIREGKYI